MSLDAPRPVAGVDGCKAGWIMVRRLADGTQAAAIHQSFESLVQSLPPDSVLAVDMPIGLPARTRRGGRGPEGLVRPLLGERQSSVFSIPSRASVYAGEAGFTTIARWYEAHRVASAIARATSDPPRGVSIQAFGIFGKIIELDRLLLARPELRCRIVESHPELAFWRLNDGRPMTLPKKVKGAVHGPGMEERRALLARHGIDSAILRGPVPRGAGADDLLDACAMALVAARVARGEAQRFPDPPLVDEMGIPVAIQV